MVLIGVCDHCLSLIAIECGEISATDYRATVWPDAQARFKTRLTVPRSASIFFCKSMIA
jgi:hypothetical protein